jgi:hypothetical protein
MLPRKHGLRTPHADAPALPAISVFDPVRAGSNGLSDSLLDSFPTIQRSISGIMLFMCHACQTIFINTQ